MNNEEYLKMQKFWDNNSNKLLNQFLEENTDFIYTDDSLSDIDRNPLFQDFVEREYTVWKSKEE